MFAGAVLFGSVAIPSVAQAQIKMPNYEIKTAKGDDVLLLNAGGLNYNISDKANPAKTIGSINYQTCKVSGDMDNAAELTRVKEACTTRTGWSQYTGAVPDAQVAQAAPAFVPPATPAAAPSTGFVVESINIIKATDEKLEFEVTMSGATHKFVVDAGGNGALKAAGAMGTNIRYGGGSGSSGFAAMTGKTIRVHEEGYQNVQFTPDGKLSMEGDTRANGAWTRIQLMKDGFGQAADKVKSLLPETPKYYAVLLTIAGRSPDAK